MGMIASQITSLTIVLLNRLFRHRSKKTSKLRVTGLCAGNSPEAGEFPAQMASNAEMFPFEDVIMDCFNIQMSYQCMNSHYKDKMVTWPFYLYIVNVYTWEDGLYIETRPKFSGCRWQLEGDFLCRHYINGLLWGDTTGHWWIPITKDRQCKVSKVWDKQGFHEHHFKTFHNNILKCLQSAATGPG